MSEHYFEEEEFNTQFNGQTMFRIVQHGLKHWKLMLGFMFGIIGVSVLESYFTYLSKEMIDEGILANNTEALYRIAWEYGLLYLIFAGLVFLFIVCAGTLGHRVQYDLRRLMFDNLQKLSLSYYDRTPAGWIMSRVTSDATRVGDLVSWGILDMTWAVTNIITALFFMFIINVQVTLVVLVMLPILVIISNKFKQKILVEYRKARQLNSKITGEYSQNITGVRVVKALRREEENLDEFSDLTNKMFQASFRAAWLSALFLPIVQLISAGTIAAIVWYGGIQYQSEAITIGGIQAFISYITFMLWPIQQLAAVYASMQQAIASAERIFSLVDAMPEIVDETTAVSPPSLIGDIVFRDVDFQYEKDKPVFANLNLHIKQGETIALVGPTGAGKSTLVNLLCRFYQPTHGSIEIAGQDYKQWTLHGIQSRVGMVLQTPHLFSGTIMENLRYGRLDATDQEVIESAKMAGADGFINQLENAYQTEVGEGGVLLSVGQKQLISIARAILAKPDIFIMDEATSSVDTLTESLIQQAMDRVMEGRTSFVIAHRLSTIKNADRILVIEKGGISEVGTHAELIRARGHYYDLYTKQFRKERGLSLGGDELPIAFA